MNFTFSEEQEELRRTIRRFFDGKSPSSEVRRLMETPEGYDEAVWKQMAQELGLQAIAIPEEYGGQGYTFVELGIVLEEAGRALLCAPFLATAAIAAHAILNAGTDEQKKALLPGIASGETIATLALAEPDKGWTADDITLEAKDGVLNGSKTYVIDGHLANTCKLALARPDVANIFPQYAKGRTRHGWQMLAGFDVPGPHTLVVQAVDSDGATRDIGVLTVTAVDK